MSHSLLRETESNYLILSRRQKCQKLIGQRELGEEDLIEFYIALHVVLEVGLNALLRHLALHRTQLFFNKAEMIDQIDDINFKDKTAMFLYYAQFDFSNSVNEAKEHHDILKKITHFSAIRNELLHGHSISTFISNGEQRDSDARRKMNQKTLDQQINLFKDIIKGMSFYLDHLIDFDDLKLDKEKLKKDYLSLDFLTGYNN
jgi:hypothetical protein